MEVDKQTIKALSADTRIDILKSLQKRRKMPSELSREFSLAPSTITEHLKHLEGVGLIEKKHTGHKWIYYQLTAKGSGVLSPRYPVNIILTLGIGLIFLVGGFSYYFIGSSGLGQGYSVMNKDIMESSKTAPMAAAPEPTDNSGVVRETGSSEMMPMAVPPASIDKVERAEIGKPFIYLAIAVVGIVMLAVGSFLLFRRSNKINVPIR